MEKKYQIIYIWAFIIVSGIVLLLLYTPLGGNLHYAAYNDQYRYMVAPGVDASHQIGASFSGPSASRSYNYSIPSIAYTSPSFKAGSGSFTTRSSPSNFSSGYSAGGGFTLSSNRSFSAGGSGGGSGLGLLAVGGGNSSDGDNNGSVGGFGGGFNPGSSNTTVMQRGTSGIDDELDPGGDPTSPPLGLPLGNELYVLLFFAASYILFKQKLFRH
ncbi:MAG: hypothetical protein AUK44_02975 [Porphyromonadaceae bacterium CG2_30_38_12]|nr:MAG: hypothetical protein AUK44_02975 [Porphyromonadaceae bacterium CG2_30_38_12]